MLSPRASGWFWLPLTLALTLLLAACGGGGGGPGIPAEYTGVTTQAVITADNVEQLVLDAYAGGNSAGDLLGLMPLTEADPGASPRVRQIGGLLEKIARSLPLGASVAPLVVEPPVFGSCGGQYVVSVTETSNSAYGSIIFADYCENGVTLSGTLSFSATASGNTGVLTLTFKALTSSDAQGGFTLSGSFTLRLNLETENGTITMRLVFEDLVTLETLYISYTLAMTPGPDLSPVDGWPDYEEITVTGRFYAHNDGYLLITTEIPVRTDDGALEPSAGRLRFSGANGTWATYEITGPGAYTIIYFDGTSQGTIIHPAPID